MFRNAQTFRRRAAAASLVAAPLLILAGLAVAPWEEEAGSSSAYVAAVASDPAAAQLSALLLHFGYLLLVPCVWAMAHYLRRDAVVLGNVGLLIGTVGAIGNSGVVLNDYADVMLVEKLPLAQAVELYDHGQSLWGFVVAAIAGFPLLVLGLVLLFVGLWRARVLPAWALAVPPAAVAASNLADGRLSAIVAFSGVCGLLAYLGVRTFAATDGEWEHAARGGRSAIATA